MRNIVPIILVAATVLVGCHSPSRVSTQMVSLSLFTQPQRNDRIEYKASLSGPDWLTLTHVTAAPNPLKITDPIPRTKSCRFCRAIVVP